MQYPKTQEFAPSADLLKEAFHCASEILVLFQGDGMVIETNALADQYSHKPHLFNVGELLWQEKFWLSEWDRKKCHRAFQTVLTGQMAEFVAALGDEAGHPEHFHFGLQQLNIGDAADRYFMMSGIKKAF